MLPLTFQPRVMNVEIFPELIEPSSQMAADYWSLIVNQPAYTVMTDNRSDPETNKYYRPKLNQKSDEFKALTIDTIRRHLRGEITCMFYAADPRTQRSKWACIDADYPNATSDLAILQSRFLELGLSPLLEESQRGGHLWLFADEPLLTVQLRAFLLSVAGDLDLPIFSSDGKSSGLEVFPRQDFLEGGRFGNGVRGPLGVHRKDFRRYWFHDAPRSFMSQIALLSGARRLTQPRLDAFTAGLVMTSPPPSSSVKHKPVTSRQIFSIFDQFPPPSSGGADYKVVCPSCSKRRLVITAKGSRRGFYHCFSGCTTSSIRMALGRPLSQVRT